MTFSSPWWWKKEGKKERKKDGAPVILQNSGLAGQQVDSHTFRTASAVDRLSAVAPRDNTHSRYILGWWMVIHLTQRLRLTEAMGHDCTIIIYLFLKHFTLTLHTSWPPVQSRHKTSTSPSPKPTMTLRLARHWLRCSVRSALYHEPSSCSTYKLLLLLRSSPGTSGTSAPPMQAMCKKFRSAPYKLDRSFCEAIPKETSKCHH